MTRQSGSVLCCIACLGAALASGQAPRVQTLSASEAIAAANSQYEHIMNADAPAVGALGAQFAEDAYLLIPNLELISGRPAIERSLAQTAGQISNVSLKTSRVKASGSLAYELGKWSSTIDGRPSVGNYLAFWRREGDRWLRAGSCSVPETGAASLSFSAPETVFTKGNPVRTKGGTTTSARLVGDGSVWRAAQQIQQLTDRYAEVVNRGTPVKGELHGVLSSMYTKDTVVLLPEVNPLEGLEVVEEECTALEAAGTVSGVGFELETVEARKDAELTFARSRYRNNVRSASGKMIGGSGNYMAVWTVEDGQWRIGASCTANTTLTPAIAGLTNPH